MGHGQSPSLHRIGGAFITHIGPIGHDGQLLNKVSHGQRQLTQYQLIAASFNVHSLGVQLQPLEQAHSLAIARYKNDGSGHFRPPFGGYLKMVCL